MNLGSIISSFMSKFRDIVLEAVDHRVQIR